MNSTTEMALAQAVCLPTTIGPEQRGIADHRVTNRGARRQRTVAADDMQPASGPLPGVAAHPDRPTVLVVDDVPDNLAVVAGLLATSYRVLAATTGSRALELAARAPAPDLILLDIMMPGLDGYQVFDRLRADPGTRDIPVVFVTALQGESSQVQCLELGAVDYITKPVVPAVLQARVRTQLELSRARIVLQDQNVALEREVARRMEENDLTQQVTIRALAHLAESRDPETGNHILRTQGYVRCLATRLRHHPRFAPQLTDRSIELMTRCAPLHDLGKVGIPDAILRKPGKLTAAEWEVMKTHAQIGAEAIERAERDIDRRLDFLATAKAIARSHHERWDGGGYPDGLKGNDIPLAARLMAVADVFDALISARVYKGAMSHAEARAIIVAGHGSHFDPDICDAFVASFDDFVALATEFQDAL